MQALAMICNEQQKFSIEDVTLKDLEPGEVLVRNEYSGVSIGTEFALIRNKISWGPFPICPGYMSTGVIEAVGEGVDSLSLGEKVYTRGNNTNTMTLNDGTKVSCTSGAHASHIIARVESTHGVEKLPEGVAMDVASTFVMPAVALYGVDMANPRMGQTVVVFGTGLIGLGVVAACVHRGCVVIAVDLDANRLAVAKSLGADYLINGSTENVSTAVHKIVPDGADAVFESTGIPACIDLAIPLCRSFGSFVWQGNYGADPVSFHFLPAHGRRLQMFFPCDDGLQPCRRAVLKNIAMGTLDWEQTITHRIDYTDAPGMYARINQGDKSILGMVIRW
ncbi:MAG: zinc-binding alcohol dehydrogenase [Anaerolineae bacterium]|nr:zinc-binding alcohol dehydrogenase [Anaerolineae bacterium]